MPALINAAVPVFEPGQDDAQAARPSLLNGATPLAPSPSLAEAADWHRQNLADTYAAVKDPQTWQDAAQAYSNALLAGSVAPTESPAFRAWFGRSVAKDAEGKPLVLYHGTTADFDAFSKQMRGSATGVKDAKQGFFFTDSPKVAEDFLPYATDDGQVVKRAGSNILPVHLKMENPAEWDWGGGQSNERDILAAIRDARKAGNDGLIINDIRDPGFSGGFGRRSTHYVVFDPKQIKSAIGNRGTFDPKDPRITYGVGGLATGAAAAGGQDQQ